jgi:hypothetical protein
MPEQTIQNLMRCGTEEQVAEMFAASDLSWHEIWDRLSSRWHGAAERTNMMRLIQSKRLEQPTEEREKVKFTVRARPPLGGGIVGKKPKRQIDLGDE